MHNVKNNKVEMNENNCTEKNETICTAYSKQRTDKGKNYIIHPSNCLPVEDFHEEAGVADTGNLQRALHALQHAVTVTVALAAVGVLRRPEEHAAHADQTALVRLLQQLVAVLRHLTSFSEKRLEKGGVQETLQK